VKNLGKIHLLLLFDKYSVQFKYSHPRKIDLFELILLEIIKHKDNISNKTIEDTLLMLEIPKEFHYIFLKKIGDFVNNNPKIIATKDGDDDLIKNFFDLELMVSNFFLTPLGEKILSSYQIIEEAQSISEEYVYDTMTNTLSYPKKIQSRDNAIELYMLNPDPSNVNETFTKLILKNPFKYIKNITEKPIIYDLAAIPAGTEGFFGNIDIIADNGKIKFETNNEKIKKTFLEASSEEKNQLRSKQIFYYYDIPQVKVNYENAKIAVKRQQLIKMKVAFGEKEAIKTLTLTDEKSIYIMNSQEYNFCFAGITESGKMLVYNYCEITEEGYTIPLEEENNSMKKYSEIFDTALKMYKSHIEFIIHAAPRDRKALLIEDYITNISEIGDYLLNDNFADINEIENSLLVVFLKSTETILNDIINDNEILSIINNRLLEILKENVKKQKIDISKVIEIMNKYKLSKEKIIKMFAENAPKTDEIINSLLAVDEPTVIQIYELKKMYNLLLKSSKLSEIKHNSNMYIRFADYERQFKKLKTMGLNDYNNYEIKDWDIFMKEIYILREKFNHVKKYIEDVNLLKQANDFYERIQDDYDAIIPVDNKKIKNILDLDLNKEINDGKYDIVMIASAIRFNYEEYLRNLEKRKDPKANGSRKGRSLIQFTIVPKLADDVYIHWKNLCTIIHKATSQNDPLWKGNDEGRQKALKSALSFYYKNFAAKEEKNEPSDKSAV